MIQSCGGTIVVVGGFTDCKASRKDEGGEYDGHADEGGGEGGDGTE